VSEVGEESFGAEKGAKKSLRRGRGCVFGSFPKQLELPHLNWCIGDCWFIPALLEHLQRWCSACDPVKIFFTSKFSYALVCDPIHKTESETANWCGTTNSKPPGPIIMMGESETLSSTQNCSPLYQPWHQEQIMRR
jgi:hypothetical protein